jgi:hypothetical protein
VKEVMRVQKVKSGGVRGIQRENNRTVADKGSFPLSEIDWSRTGDNEILIESQDWKKDIQKALEGHGITSVRKDATVLVDVVYSASPGFFEGITAEEQREYFRQCVDFHQKNYGEVINAVIHRDEKTPHLHVVSVPLVRRDDGWHLCAKELLGNRKEFRQRLTDFHLDVGKDFGLERGESRDPAVRKRHQEAWEHRVETLQAEADALRGEIWSLESQRDAVAADLGDKVTVQKLAEWAEVIRDKICGLISGIKDWLEILLCKVEDKAVLIRDDLERASCRMRGITYIPTGEKFKYPATRDGDPLTWQGYSPLYVQDGLRYIPSSYAMKDGGMGFVEHEQFCRDNRDPAAVDFMDRLEDVTEQLQDLEKALAREERHTDSVEKERLD